MERPGDVVYFDTSDTSFHFPRRSSGIDLA